MEGIKQWAFSICCAMVACGIAQMLLPKSNMSKMLQITVSVFFLCSILSPIILQKPDLRISVSEYSNKDIEQRAGELTKVIDIQSEQVAKEKLVKIISDKLLQNGINYISITIHINTNGQNNLQPWAEVVLDKQFEGEHEKIAKMMNDDLGMDVKLGYG